jgi:hypothetical protein
MLDRFKGNSGSADVDTLSAPHEAPTAEVIADNKRQVEQLRPYIRPHEVLRAVFDMRGGGTGFLGITDRRLIIYDKAFLGKRKAMVSVPFGKVTRVASEDEAGGMFSVNAFKSSTLTVCVGSECYDFEFRGVDKAHRAYELMIDAIL